MLADFQPVNYSGATGRGPTEEHTLHLPQAVILPSPAYYPTSPLAIIFKHIMGVITTNEASLATVSLGWFKHAQYSWSGTHNRQRDGRRLEPTNRRATSFTLNVHKRTTSYALDATTVGKEYPPWDI